MRIVLVLDNIRSAHNVGSLLRSADGFGVGKVVSIGITPHMEQVDDPRLPHIIQTAEQRISKTALGAQHLMRQHFATTEDFLSWQSNQKSQLVSLELDDRAVNVGSFEPSSDISLILGNELDGVSSALLKKSDEVIQIPMHGQKESLNVSISGAVALYVLSAKFAKL